MSSMAEESLKSFIKDFGKNGLAKVEHENVRTISYKVDGIAKRLADSNFLRSEPFIQYLTGYTRCSVTVFKEVFNHKLTEFMYLDATGGDHFSSLASTEVLDNINELSQAAVAIYDHLQLGIGKKWNLPGKQFNAVLVPPKCDNCGDPNHLSPKCPKPRDEEKCKKARELRAKSGATNRGRGGRGQGGRGGRGDGSGRGSDSQGQRAPWDSTAATGANPGSGVKMIDGVCKMHCTKGCGWNESHTSDCMHPTTVARRRNARIANAVSGPGQE
jgi:hypothetical protein